jgi:hypothetical protein
MNSICKTLGLIVLSVSSFQVCSAAQVIDQNSPGELGRSLSGPEVIVQSFVQLASNISGAEIGIDLGNSVNPQTPPTAMNIALWTSLPRTAGSVSLASMGGVYSVSSGFGIFKANWSPVSVSAGQTYFLEFTSTASYPRTYFSVGRNDYLPGDIFSNNADGTFRPIFAGVDLNFKTFQDNQFVSAVPEPSEWVLMVAGLGLVGALARTRKNR